MIKVFGLFKRKPGMTMEAFIDHYENVHAKLGVKYLDTMAHYSRHYMRPVAEPLEGKIFEADYDVVTEIWFNNQEDMDRFFTTIHEPKPSAIFSADEENLFDRPRNRLVIVESYESEL